MKCWICQTAKETLVLLEDCKNQRLIANPAHPNPIFRISISVNAALELASVRRVIAATSSIEMADDFQGESL